MVASGSIQAAIEAWQQLYNGEVEPYPVSDEVPGIHAVAVRRADFRAARGNWPRIFHHREPTDKALVLIHGLKDSPGYLEDIALRFARLGVTVVLPLLPGHGRWDPAKAMRRADRQAWRSTVDRSVEIAAMLGGEVSIGGLSTGGALAVDKCQRDGTAIAGKVFLFSGALGLRPIQRLVLATDFVPRWADALAARRPNTGIGGNRYKYSRHFLIGARQVHLLIEEIRQRTDGRPAFLDRHGDRLFVAHTEADRTIPVAAVLPFVQPDDPGQHHIIPAARGVAHAELVLAEAMTYHRRWPDEKHPPRANPEFEPMIEKTLAFLER